MDLESVHALLDWAMERPHRKRSPPRKVKRCPHCGTTVKSDRRVYCSESCRLEYASERRNAHLKRTDDCPVCGRWFTTAHPNKVFCSESCRRQSRRGKETTTPNPNPQN